MKQHIKIAFTILMLISIVCMFLPVAQFQDNSSASMAADIEKQEGKVKSAQDQLDRWIAGGKKSEADINKQRDKVAKEQGKLDELLAEQASASTESSSGLSYAFLPNKLPDAIQIDMEVVNTNHGLYPTDLSSYQIMLWVILAAYLLSVGLVWCGGSKLNSKLYTLSSFLHITGLVLSVYCVLRLAAIPVKLPYGNAQLNLIIVALLLVCSAAAFFLHVSSVQNTKRSMIYVFCTLLSIMALLPFWIMIVNATRNSQAIQQGISLIPGSSIANNWNVIAKQKSFDVVNGFKNSVIISFGSTILSVYFSALTAYGFEVYDFKGKKFLWAVVMAIIMIPGQVTGTGFYMFMYQIGMVNNRLALIVPSIAAASTVFFFRQYLQANFQKSLVEAARIDGAGEFYIYNGIIMPIMIPAMATMGIMAVIGSWNNYLTPLMLLPDKSKHTLPLLVYALRGDIYRTEYGSIYLGLTLTALPLIIVYFALSKYIIAGVAVGGVKE